VRAALPCEQPAGAFVDQFLTSRQHIVVPSRQRRTNGEWRTFGAMGGTAVRGGFLPFPRASTLDRSGGEDR
jgi:hypothetical protein